MVFRGVPGMCVHVGSMVVPSGTMVLSMCFHDPMAPHWYLHGLMVHRAFIVCTLQ